MSPLTVKEKITIIWNSKNYQTGIQKKRFTDKLLTKMVWKTTIGYVSYLTENSFSVCWVLIRLVTERPPSPSTFLVYIKVIGFTATVSHDPTGFALFGAHQLQVTARSDIYTSVEGHHSLSFPSHSAIYYAPTTLGTSSVWTDTYFIFRLLHFVYV